jgi:hypothetical protein
MNELAKIAQIVAQIGSVSNIGVAGLMQIMNGVNAIAAVCRQKGYDVDTKTLTGVIEDAMRRQQIAEQESKATE